MILAFVASTIISFCIGAFVCRSIMECDFQFREDEIRHEERKRAATILKSFDTNRIRFEEHMEELKRKYL